MSQENNGGTLNTTLGQGDGCVVTLVASASSVPLSQIAPTVGQPVPTWLVAITPKKTDPPMGLRCGNLTAKEALYREVLERHLRNALRFAFSQQRDQLFANANQLDIDKFIDHAVTGLLGFDTENGLSGRYDPAFPAPPGLFAVLTQLMAGQRQLPSLLGDAEVWSEPR